VATLEEQVVLREGGREEEDRRDKFEHELFEQFLDGKFKIGIPGVEARLLAY
jgi:hypothetical protein